MFNQPSRLVVEFRRLNIQQVREILRSSVVRNYIRHTATVQLLSELLQRQLDVNSGVYVYRGNERIIIVTLLTPQRGQEVNNLRLEDIVFYEVVVHTLE
jgi:integrase